MLMLAILAAQALPAPLAPSVEQRMASLYDQVCLHAFPDDAAVAAAMTARGATPLRREEVRIYLHDDPGRGWRLADGDQPFVVTVELPPYHACSVRRQTTSGLADARPYHAVIDAYRAANPGFQDFPEQTMPMGDRLSTADGAMRQRPDGMAEALYRFAVHAAEPAQAARYGVEVRYVHQIRAGNLPD